MNIEEAKVTLTGGEGDSKLDKLADDLLKRVGAFFGECIKEDFAGFGIDESRDESGKLLSLRIVPCDLVDGEPVRRVAR